MKRTKQEYLNLLEETVNYYNQDTTRRGVAPKGWCEYYVSKKKMCAVGRCLGEPIKIQEAIHLNDIGKPFASTGIDDIINDYNIMAKGDLEFKKEYQRFNVKFWKTLQALHDHNGFWGENGLTVSGLKRVEEIKTKIIEDIYNEN